MHCILCRYYLTREWERNRQSLLKFLGEVHRGFKGVVTNNAGKPIKGAMVSLLISGNNPAGKVVKTSDRGEYWVMALPGEYRMKVQLDKCVKKLDVVRLTEKNRLFVHNITLECGNDK